MVRPVLWQTLGFDGVGEAHQLMRDNKHLGKISILVGRREGGPRQDRGRVRARSWRRSAREPTAGNATRASSSRSKWVGEPLPRRRVRGDHGCRAAEAALDFGATGWALFRDQDGQLDFTQLAFFPTKLDFERYWYSDEIGAARAAGRGLLPGARSCPTFHTVRRAPGALDARGTDYVRRSPCPRECAGAQQHEQDEVVAAWSASQLVLDAAAGSPTQSPADDGATPCRRAASGPRPPVK